VVGRRVVAEVDGRRLDVRLLLPESALAAGAAGPPRRRRRAAADNGAAPAPVQNGGTDAVSTPMQGTVLRVLVQAGQAVSAGEVLCIVEAMKMENEVVAHRAGTVSELNVSEGQTVQANEVIAVISE
jgi:acetyl-CoA/propionyl-CoA carboxylase biotin carboxyl carrier protein